MTTMQTDFTEEELLATAAIAEPLFAAGVRCHGGFDTDGAYVSPRTANRVPGIRPYEEPAYWRDVGTIDTYFATHQDVLGLEPRVEVFNPWWPIISSNYQGPVAKIISGDIQNSILAGGTLVNGATVRNSVIRREVMLDDNVEIDDCIIMDYSHICSGCRLRRVIVDRFNVIKPNTTIGYDHAADAKLYHVTPSGITVVPDSMMMQGARARATFEHHG